ncbi:hypothetical protein G6F56_005342 [Rhizopus delemar]|nr:hypothetical protein G6F56_005342 [Rhizopus delemar]
MEYIVDDKTGPEWSKFKIDFMTGDNHNQKFLKNVAANLDATSNVSSLHWVAPQVEPNAAIYFFMFTNEKGEHAWTTRFGITGLDGKLSPPQHDTQPDGKKIPWGVGKLLKSGNSTSHTTSAVYSMTPAQSSVAAENAALIIAVSSANKIYSGLFMLMACVIFSIVLFTH